MQALKMETAGHDDDHDERFKACSGPGQDPSD